VIRLLIVDDSALMRRLLSGIFTQAGDFEISVARNGAEALDMLVQVEPHVITLDVHMPGMDGLACLDRIMVLHPCPVVMVSSLTEQGAAETLEAMALGAVDVVPKPAGAPSLEIGAVAEELVAKVRSAAKARIPRSLRLRDRLRMARIAAVRSTSKAPSTLQPISGGPGLVLVGCSTGGRLPLMRCLPG
jgi:two-component system chemotaxis response regulator CheB